MSERNHVTLPELSEAFEAYEDVYSRHFRAHMVTNIHNGMTQRSPLMTDQEFEIWKENRPPTDADTLLALDEEFNEAVHSVAERFGIQPDEVAGLRHAVTEETFRQKYAIDGLIWHEGIALKPDAEDIKGVITMAKLTNAPCNVHNGVYPYLVEINPTDTHAATLTKIRDMGFDVLGESLAAYSAGVLEQELASEGKTPARLAAAWCINTFTP